MVNSYPITSLCRRLIWMGIMLLAGVSTFAGANRTYLRVTTSTYGGMLRISGKLLERTSQRPLSGAIIMVKAGDMVLANQSTNDKGEFILYIPPEKVSRRFLSVKIKYRNHIFLKDNIEPMTQEMLIEINGAVFLESEPIGDYNLPIHTLGKPQVGRVLVRTRDVKRQQQLDTSVKRRI